MIKIVVPIAATDENIRRMLNYVESPEFQLEMISRYYDFKTNETEYKQDAFVEVNGERKNRPSNP